MFSLRLESISDHISWATDDKVAEEVEICYLVPVLNYSTKPTYTRL